MVILANRIGKPVSEILGIKNKYESYCIDGTACYVYDRFVERSKNKKELEEMMDKHSVRKRK